jgi:putative ABC transport system permease protein
MNHLRAKEVSIRKVLGANIRQVFYTLSKEFFKIAGTAFLIAIPLVFVFGGLWLDSFAYKIPFSPAPFAFGGLIILFTVLITVGYETIKTARLNPIDKLRDE